MPWIWAALMPHPPVLVPEVGRGREREAAETLEGIERLAKKLSGLRPDRLLLLSPHQPYSPGALFVNVAQRLAGSLAPFGAPSAAFETGTPLAQAQRLAEHLTKQGLPVRMEESPGLTRDQGSLVPLYFLERAWRGEKTGAGLPPVVFASPIGLDMDAASSLGRFLASFDDGSNWALLASGDLSHRLTPDAPAGYSLVGKPFDEAVVAALSSNDPRPLLALSAEELEDAGECGLRSVMAMLGLCGTFGRGAPIEVLSYEGPFGVGYCCALCVAEKQSEKPHPYVSLARAAVECFLCGEGLPTSGNEIDPDVGLWDKKRACFVSIKKLDGNLRGCIGTILPSHPRLDLEIVANAVAASTRDPRFRPMEAFELEEVSFSVDVLGLPEPVTDRSDLDPAEWGVVVSKGMRRGVLLPDLEGVNTVDEQLGIAAQKAGIWDLEGISIERFRVDRYKE